MKNSRSVFSFATSSLAKAVLFLCLMTTEGCDRNDTSFWAQIYHNFSAYFNAYYNAEKIFNQAVEWLSKKQNYNDDAPLDIFYKSNEMLNATLFNAVIKKTSMILQRHPSSEWADNALFLLAKSYHYQKDYVAAYRKFRELFVNYPDSDIYPDAIDWYARTLVAQGLVIDAKKTLESVINSSSSKNESKANAYFLLAELCIYPKTSYPYYIAQIQKKMKSSDSLFVLNNEILSVYSLEEAVINIQSGLKVKTNDDVKARAYFVLGRIYDLLKYYRAARESYQAAFDMGYDGDLKLGAKLGIARNFRLEKKYSEALKEYEFLLLNGKYLKNFGKIRYEISEMHLENNRTDKAIEMYFDIVRNDPKTDYAAKSFYQLGLTKEKRYLDYLGASILYDSAVANLTQKSNKEIVAQISSAYDRVQKINEINTRIKQLGNALEGGIQKSIFIRDSLSLSLGDRMDVFRNRKDYRRSSTEKYIREGGKDALSNIVLTTIKVRQKKTIVYTPPSDSLTFLNYQKEYFNLYARKANFYHIEADQYDSAMTWYKKTLAEIDVNKKKEKYKSPFLEEFIGLEMNTKYSISVLLNSINEEELAKEVEDDILKQYPHSSYSAYIRQSRGQKQIIKATIKPEEYLYEQMYQFLENNQNAEAFVCFELIQKKYFTTLYASKSLYLLGTWFVWQRKESEAMFLYFTLKKVFPESIESKRIQIPTALYDQGMKQIKQTLLPIDTTAKKISTPLADSMAIMLPKIQQLATAIPQMDSITSVMGNFMDKKRFYQSMLDQDKIVSAFNFDAINSHFPIEGTGRVAVDYGDILREIIKYRKNKIN